MHICKIFHLKRVVSTTGGGFFEARRLGLNSYNNKILRYEFKSHSEKVIAFFNMFVYIFLFNIYIYFKYECLCMI